MKAFKSYNKLCLRFHAQWYSFLYNSTGIRAKHLKLIELLKNFYAQVMPFLDREMFSVVETRGGPFSEPEACAILSQIVGGLEVAHSLGLAHHDMSLENLMANAAGGAFIIDWGMVVKVPLTTRKIPVRLKIRNFNVDTSWALEIGRNDGGNTLHDMPRSVF